MCVAYALLLYALLMYALQPIYALQQHHAKVTPQPVSVAAAFVTNTALLLPPLLLPCHSQSLAPASFTLQLEDRTQCLATGAVSYR